MNIDADGFDHYGTVDYVAKYWTGTPSSIEDGRPAVGPSDVAVRKAVGLSNTSIRRSWGTSEPTLTCGFAFRASSINDAIIMSFNYNSDVQIGLQLTAAGTINVFRQFPFNVIGTCSGPSSSIIANTWSYIEVRCFFDPSFGVVTVHKDGATIGDFLSEDTDPVAIGAANSIVLGGSATFPFANLRFDDFYLNDNNGPFDDTFMGDIAIHTVLPLANGTTNQFSPTGEPSQYECVDTVPPNEGTVYVRGSNGDIDEYQGASFSHLSFNIYFARTVQFSKKVDVGLLEFKHRIRVNAATATSLAIAATPDFTYTTELFRQNPDGAVDWTPITISNIVFGPEVV